MKHPPELAGLCSGFFSGKERITMHGKTIGMGFIIGMGILLLYAASSCETIDELADKYETAYESAVPPPNSSMNNDYKMEQVALGTMYTAKSMKLLYHQNQTIIQQNQEILRKYDKMIEQNNEMIKLLRIIMQRQTPAHP
jgi:hypothetical protein